MLIGCLGIGSQWVAWRYKIPAIVVMSITGLIVGPIFGLINPQQDFGNLYDPMISVAVAIILFEGSLNLKFKELTGLGKPLFRIATLGAFIAWILGSLTAHYVAGLSWTVAFVIGGLFIVTGPTVIMPLLRQSKLKPRPAKILKWEGIVVDPFGVLLAVFAFEIITYLTATDPNGAALLLFFAAAIFAVVFGWGCGRFTAWIFDSGVVPEFLKSPAVLVIVILSFTVADEMIKGTGLLSVTAMGMTLANIKTTSVADMRHFKEDISILLISSIFIMVAASLQVETLLQIFSPNIIGYVILMMFAVRPLSIFLSTIGSGLSLQEKTLIGWIAPRGIVALTVSSYFATTLEDAGYQDASMLLTLTFGLVFFTVVAHGFSIGWLAKKLNLSMEGRPGIIITGSNLFTVELAKSFQKLNTPVMIVDNSWERLVDARKADVPYYYGSLLSEQTEYNLDTIPYEYLIASTDSHTYNALICTTFMPEYGRNNVFKVSPYEDKASSPSDLVDQIGGRILFTKEVSIRELIGKVRKGYTFRQTTITAQYNYQQYMSEKDDSTIFLYFVKSSGQIKFFSEGMRAYPGQGDTVISITPPNKEIKKIQQKIADQKNE
jgi:NhaP-type Na+/H+ or K+/H+ antiporter